MRVFGAGLATEANAFSPIATTMANAIATTMANAIVIYKEYPHTNIGARARELVNIAFDACAKKTRPVMSVCSGCFISICHTTKSPMIEFVQKLKLIEEEEEETVLSVSAVHGFPWGDVPEVGSKILVVTDSGKVFGATVAKNLTKQRDIIADDAFTPLRGLLF